MFDAPMTPTRVLEVSRCSTISQIHSRNASAVIYAFVIISRPLKIPLLLRKITTCAEAPHQQNEFVLLIRYRHVVAFDTHKTQNLCHGHKTVLLCVVRITMIYFARGEYLYL